MGAYRSKYPAFGTLPGPAFLTGSVPPSKKIEKMSNEESTHNDVKNVIKKPRRRLRDIDLSKVGKKMQIILDREIDLIFDESRAGLLDEKSHKKFLNYLKLLPELRDQENEDLNDLSDEELGKLLNKTQKKGQKHEQSD